MEKITIYSINAFTLQKTDIAPFSKGVSRRYYCTRYMDSAVVINGIASAMNNDGELIHRRVSENNEGELHTVIMSMLA